MLTKPAVQAFAQQAHKRSFSPRHTVIHAGDPPQSLYLILEGSVSVLLEDQHGREIVLAYLGPGEFFGELCLFPEQESRTAIVRTRAPTLAAEMGYQAFLDFTKRYPDIMFDLAGQLANRLRDTTGRLVDLTFLDVTGRMARTLLNLSKKRDAQPHEKGTLIKTSRQELARLVGCSREMAGRVLKRLEEQGTVSSKGRSILILGVRKPGA
ncbi:CRP/FNR family transcriptional regulator, cyclic AMP receptor protein [Solimonas aquatica]|uniref:CRP/FNR family transcriptional regulator, cyclic AMP receptor protein n=1 Tax=Solimonas aquatica TaxID=489703 RepID=A0A1H9CT43_9GAMM|nr:cyclic nucleotide-binding domain-containing protein [Solimonas aquatica]SEQ04392.1 CRP/FNR family transcriptional regulator, cyclic AMP receptor protein [Solimonas aquatica]